MRNKNQLKIEQRVRSSKEVRLLKETLCVNLTKEIRDNVDRRYGYLGSTIEKSPVLHLPLLPPSPSPAFFNTYRCAFRDVQSVAAAAQMRSSIFYCAAIKC